MSTRVVERVDTWDDRPFEDGYRTLHELADRNFSGVVRAGGAELFMTKGVVVGISQGTIESFEGATGTIYEAPAAALPLLAVMQDRSDEVRAKYYSEETAMSKVDKKLSDGNFTGFIELSENVLSGDYYLVYHRGRSMSVAFVGESSRLIDGDEAFQKADNEVGIYEVKPVDIEPIEIPEPSDPEPDPEPASGAAAGAAEGAEQASESGDATQEAAESSQTGADDAAREATGADSETPGKPAGDEVSQDSDTGVGGTADEDSATAEPSGQETPQSGTEPESEASHPSDAGHEESPDTSREESRSTDAGREQSSESETTPEQDTSRDRDRDTQSRSQDTTRGQGTGSQESTTARQSRAAESRQTESRQTESRSQQSAETTRERADQTSNSQGAAGGGRDPLAGGGGGNPASPETAGDQPAGTTGEGRPLETRSIPSLDPNKTEVGESTPDTTARADSPSGTRAQGSTAQAQGTAGAGPEPSPATREPEPEPEPEPESETQPETNTAEPAGQESVDHERIEQLQSELEDREAEIERIESELRSVTDERDDLRRELEAVREERDELAEEVERLEEELERLETEFGAATDAERRMTPREALDGTDIFVRYHSKGDATLAKAHDGGVRRSDVEDNLRLEKHTQFEADTVAVGGQTFEEFLEETLEFQFVKWVIYELLFEIRDTGHSSELKDLFDAVPKIDRAELNGSVDVVYTEEGQETRTTEAFDVVLRDRMGDPLLVANLNDSREAATEGDMENLVTAAERVGQTSGDFASAFLVTRSFFEPGALETASEATRGGLLSRDKRKSFVNLSRKRGYHLCLVEARNRNFHLAVPEL